MGVGPQAQQKGRAERGKANGRRAQRVSAWGWGPTRNQIMCTVSIVPHRSGVRIVCNRDERRDRPVADPPEVRPSGPVQAMWPIDPASGGTWIGVNEAGIALVLLNRNPRRRRQSATPLRSRGTIIPPLLRLTALEDVLARAAALPGNRYEAFTLIALQGSRIGVIRNTNGHMRRRHLHVNRPLVFTSSSLGDHLVLTPRHALFERMVLDSRSPLRGQAAFHRHGWKTRPEISVRMQRADASTVSRTVLDIGHARVRMHYAPIGRHAGPASAICELRLAPAAVLQP